MASTIAVIALDAVEPRPIADFWCAVLGWEILEESAEGITIGAADGTWPTIDVFTVPERKAVKNRLHFDLRACDLSRDEELDRLLSLGALRVDIGQPAGASWVVLADPEGNEFCLLLRTESEARNG
ncbi:MAG TPA: VOC family protein [Candidatus Limnocylindrales bacterium]|nr:VOC family protein [Candidatus Limnocylindrales bacterium]